MPLDDADKKAIADMIAEANKGLTTELAKQFVTADAATKMVEQNLKKGLEGLDLDKKLEGLAERLKPKPGDGGDKSGDGGDKASDPSKDPAYLKLQEQLEDLKRQNKAADEARKAAEERARQERLDNSLRDALGANGVPADRIPHAMAFLKTQQLADGKPVVTIGDDGQVSWKAQRKGYVDTLSPADGAKEWLGTNDGKVYLPASGAQGTGDHAGDAGGRRPTNLPKTSDGKTDWNAIGARINLGGVTVADG